MNKRTQEKNCDKLRQVSKIRKKQEVEPYLFILPAMLMYSLFILYPIIQGFYFSLFKWSSFHNRKFIGIGNYLELFSDNLFHISLLHNAIWVGLTLAFPLVAGLILAAILIGTKGRLVISAIYFIPVTIPYVVSGIIWTWMYNPVFGTVNFVLQKMGLGFLIRGWLSDPKIALYALNILGAWTCFGFMTMIFLNALENVDQTLYEAAKLDGASTWQCFLNVTIPSLKHTIVFLVIWSTIGAMKFFDLVYITTQGGPGRSTEILGTYIFKLAFREQRIGYAQSVSNVLMILVLAFSIVLTLRSERE